ncbi:MAG: hypothetical protein HYW63_00765 [Candidatus Levybacteria bacterium]|nr:hypothetical protein [Candidatus Levybacteria bacterium]
MKKVFITVLVAIVIAFGASLILLNRQPPKDESYAHAPDYSWVTGQLQYQDIEGGFWIIRFGSRDAPYNGQFVLGKDSRLQNFKNGDLVKITGKISQDQISIYQAGTIYTLQSIEFLK